MPIQRILGAALAGCFISAVGCGLTEYEAKLNYTRDRGAYVEKTGGFLGTPLTWPDSIAKAPGSRETDPTVPSYEVFFRPPRGVSPTPDINTFAPVLFSYAADVTSGFQALYFGVSSDRNVEDVRREALARLGITNIKWDPIEVARGPGRTPLGWETNAISDRAAPLLAYSIQQDQYAVVVIFRPSGTVAENDVKARILYSLASLVTGNQASRQQQAFQQAKPPKT